MTRAAVSVCPTLALEAAARIVYNRLVAGVGLAYHYGE
jgi:hypothetical protein